ncbi:MAG: NFACT family protein [Treponema sp.]
MSLNCREIDTILGELELEGSHIQDIVQPGFGTLAFFVYGKNGAKTILICTAQNSCRIHETERKIIRNEKPLRFMECLKSKIKGAKIESCSQIGLERVVELKLLHGEKRYFCIGKTDEGILTVRFTIRDQNIRIFGAGYWRQGKKLYEEHLQ